MRTQEAYGRHLAYNPEIRSGLNHRSQRRSLALLSIACGLIVGLSLMLSLIFGGLDAYAAGTQLQEKAAVTVQPGDTLWEIAIVHGPRNRPIQQNIYEIKKANGMETSSLRIGQKLIIP